MIHNYGLYRALFIRNDKQARPFIKAIFDGNTNCVCCMVPRMPIVGVKDIDKNLSAVSHQLNSNP